MTPEQDAVHQGEETARGVAAAASKAGKDEPEDAIIGIVHERSIGRGDFLV